MDGMNTQPGWMGEFERTPGDGDGRRPGEARSHGPKS